MVYLDNAATTRVCPEAAEAAVHMMTECFGNPSTTYKLGREAKAAVDRARSQIAGALGCRPDEVFFTSCGSEGDNWALISGARSMRRRGKHIISSAVEHDAVRKSLDFLEKEGYEVVIANDGLKGVELFKSSQPSLVLLDVMLPGMDGWGVCRAIRSESKTPIIMLTAKSETEDKVSGLKQGADDYITKPFEMKEVLARIEAVLRRSGIEPEKASRRLVFDKLIIDMDAFELTVDGKKVPTPPKEMELLYHLASTPNRVYTRNQLLDEVWGFDYFGDTRTVDVHIKRLREKLEGVSDQWELKTVWSVGYKFEVNEK